jgi:hypothetical protein
MFILNLDGREFQTLAGEILSAGRGMRFQAAGESMRPFLCSGDVLTVAPLGNRPVQVGEIVLAQIAEGRLLAHRVVGVRRRAGMAQVRIQGDACAYADGWFDLKGILGRVVAVEHNGRKIQFDSAGQRLTAWLWVSLRPLAARLAWVPQAWRRRARQQLFGRLIVDGS